MSKITVYYQLSTEGQRAALLAGVSAAALQSVEVPADPYWVERATIDYSGKAVASIGGTLEIRAGSLAIARRASSNGSYVPVIESAKPLDLTSLRAWSEEAERLHTEELNANAIAEADRVARVAQAEQNREAEILVGMHAEAAKRGESALVEGVTTAAEGYERLWASATAQEAEKKAAVQAAELAWIKENGSPRLRRIAELGLGYGRLYRDERLASERPGWIWEAEMPKFTERDAYLPTEKDLDNLDRVSSYLSLTCNADSAALRRLTIYRHLTDEEQADWEGPEVDRDGDIEIARGHAIQSSFLGKPIWLQSSIPGPHRA